MITAIPRELIPILAREGEHGPLGLLTSADLHAAGLSRSQVSTLRHREQLTALARGVYTPTALFDGLDDWTRLAIRTTATLHVCPDDAIAAGWSAVALHDLPHLGRAPTVPMLIRRATPPRGSDKTARSWTRFASVPPEWVTTVDGLAVMHPATVVIDLARRSSRLSVLVIADAAARSFGGRETLAAALTMMQQWPGSTRALWCVSNADPDCETPLETIGRYAILRGGLPRPLSNVWLGTDIPRFRADHYWLKHRLALEGDGVFKYRLRQHPGSRSVDDALVAEKEREFEMRMLGVRTERYAWRVALRDPNSIVRRCAAAMAESPLRAHPQLRIWSAEEGCRILGIPRDRSATGPGPGWRSKVRTAIGSL